MLVVRRVSKLEIESLLAQDYVCNQVPRKCCKEKGQGEMEAFVTLASFLCGDVIQGHMTTSGK